MAVLKRDLLIAWSYRIRFLTGFIGGFVTVATFYYISRLVRVGDSFSPSEYFAFATIGIVIYQVLTATLTTPYMMVRQELVAGTFERMLLAPGGTVASIASLMIYPALYALFSVAVTLVFAAILFGLDLQWSTVPLALPLAILGVLAFAPFGVLLQASVVVGKKAPPGASYLVLGLSLIAGLYFPVALLPDWIEWASQVQPFTPAVDLLRWALAGQALTDPAWLAVTKLVGFALVALPISLAVMAAALRLTRRRGTILEY
jgi:ABC-2 type transport system permease protein